MKNYLCATLCCLFLLGCNSDDDRNDQQEVNVFENCCSDLPVFGDNVNVLDQSAGEISVLKIVTTNGDAFNDLFRVENIELYNNHTVTIFDNNDQMIFESTNYGGANEYFPSGTQGEFGVEGIPAGTYKYKVVIENEQTFLKSGTFCLVIGFQPDDVSFAECGECQFDPVLTCL